MGSDTLTLVSTTDSLEQVQDALGIPAGERATEAPAVEGTKNDPAPAAEPGVAAARVSPSAQKKVAEEAKPAEGKVDKPATEKPAEEGADAAADEGTEEATTEEGEGEGATSEEDDEEAQARSKAAADLGRKGGKTRGVLTKRLHRVLETSGQLRGQVSNLEGQLTAKDAEIAALRAQLAGGEKAAASPAKQGPGSPAADASPADKPPVLEDFNSYEEWVDARAEYRATKAAEKLIAQERERAAQQNAQSTAQTQHQALVETYEARQEAAREKYEDYDEVLNSEEVAGMGITLTVQQSLLESEIGPDVAYYLGQNLDEYAEILAAGNTPKAARMMGRVEAKVEAQLKEQDAAAKAAAKKPAAKEAAPAGLAGVSGKAAPGAGKVTTPATAKAPARLAAKPAVTGAPDPIEPVGTSAVGTSKSPDQMSFQEYKQWRAAGGGRR